MTSVRDRRDELDKPRGGTSGRPGPEGAAGSATGDGLVPWDGRMLFGQAKGMPWWGAVLLGFGLAIVAGFVDHGINNSFGGLFQGAYFVGCVGAICLVQRRNLFAPMVQPPLVLAVAVPAAALLGGSSGSGSLRNQILTVGTPLINQFPAMAVTTVLTVGVGIARLYVQRKPVGRAGAAKRGSKQPPVARTTKTRPPQARPGQDRTTMAIPPGERAAAQAAAAGRTTRARPAGRRPDAETRAVPRRDGDRTTRQPRPADAQRARAPREGDPRRRDAEGRPRRPRQDADRREDPPRQRGERRREDTRRGEPPRMDPQRRGREGGQPRGGPASARERARQIRENTERDVPPRRRDQTGRKPPPRNRRGED